MKHKTSVMIDLDLINEARKTDLNISGFINNALRHRFNLKLSEVELAEQKLKELYSKQEILSAEITSTEAILIELRKQQEDNDMKRKEEIYDFVAKTNPLVRPDLWGVNQ